jgi:hypothetical protein
MQPSPSAPIPLRGTHGHETAGMEGIRTSDVTAQLSNIEQGHVSARCMPPRSHTQLPEHRHPSVEAMMDEEALQAPNSIRPNRRALYTAPVVRSSKSEEPLVIPWPTQWPGMQSLRAQGLVQPCHVLVISL